MHLYQLLRQSAKAAEAIQNEDGSMPAGHNGLYNHPDTNVPNTARWLLVYCKCFDYFGDEDIREAATSAAEYLISNQARPESETYYCRNTNLKDKCNGLMGQALCIYALSVYYDLFGDESAKEIAEEVFLKHPFDDKLGVWKRVEINGKILPFDATFNHQLWFAGAGSMLKYNPEINKKTKLFLNRLPKIFDIYQSGLIKHPLRISGELCYRISKILDKNYLYLEKNSILKPYHDLSLREKAVGYHSVNLYGFSLLKKQYPNHEVWSNTKIQKALSYIGSNVYQKNIYDNPRGFVNNPTGFQNALAIEMFLNEPRERAYDWAKEQISTTYDFNSHFMNKGASDPLSQASEIYSAIHLPNYEFEG